MMLINVLAASAFYIVSPLKHACAIVPARCAPAHLVMSLSQDQKVERKSAELKASWQRSYGDSGQPEPTAAQLITMAEETLAGEAAAAEGMRALEAELAADDAKADAWWNAPENVAAREAKAARKAAAEKAAGKEDQ
jgi:hypothetical protein